MGGNDRMKQNLNGEPLNDSNEDPMGRSYRAKPDKSLTLPEVAGKFINKQKQNDKKLRNKQLNEENSSKSLPTCPETSPNLSKQRKNFIMFALLL